MSLGAENLCSCASRLRFERLFKKDLRYNASCPKVFCTIIQNQQQVNYPAVLALFQALQKMRLMDEPRKDVQTFSNKMEEMAHRISGTGSTTIHLSTLVNTYFVDCEVL